MRDSKLGQLIGWQGESFDPQQVFGTTPEPDNAHGPVQISKQPLAFVWDQFLSRQEAQHIVRLAMPRMMRSMVGGGDAINEVRTSYGMFIPRYQDAVVGRVQERLSQWLGVPVSFQEDLQVLRYAPGQEYKPHTDSNGRMATVLMYLADTAEGGETAFPDTTPSHWLNVSLALAPETLSACARNHVAVKPRIGTALLFYSMPPTAASDAAQRSVTDPFSLHAGCPPVGGLKWTATVWVHPEPFRPESFDAALKPPMPDPATCGNFHPECVAWAKRGECVANEPYMVGGAGSPGQCRLACGACTPCPAGDDACVSLSRKQQGYLPNLEAEFVELFPEATLAAAA